MHCTYLTRFYCCKNQRVRGCSVMKKILIVGIVASGKTTLAKKLSLRLDIPWFELDSIVHKRVEKQRIKQSPEEQMKEIDSINACGYWIFEGVYRASYHRLLDMADTIVFLDTPLWIRKYRIFVRFIKQKLNVESCEYKPDLHMLKMMYKWTNDFERNRADFATLLNEYRHKLIVISKPSQLNKFFEFPY